MNKFSLSYRDYRDYSRIAYLAQCQNRIIEAVTQVLYSSEPYSDPLVKTSQAIVEYEREYSSLQKGENSESIRVHTEKINTEVNGFLRNYLGLTEEDLAGIADLNESSLLILVNERLNNEK